MGLDRKTKELTNDVINCKNVHNLGWYKGCDQICDS